MCVRLVRSLAALPLLLPRCVGGSRLALGAVHPGLPLASPASAVTQLRGPVRWRCSPPVATATEEAVVVGGDMKRQRVANIFSAGTAQIGQSVLIKGWVRTVRSQKTFSFVEVNDGSSLKGVQARARASAIDARRRRRAIHVMISGPVLPRASCRSWRPTTSTVTRSWRSSRRAPP